MSARAWTAEEVAGVTNARQTGERKWQGHCPAHEDATPSLSISEGDDGRLLLTCHGGCTFEAIIAALKGSTNGGAAPARGRFGEPVATYLYTDEKCALLYQVQRDAYKNFRQRRPVVARDPGEPAWDYNLDGVRRVLYRLPEIVAAVSMQGSGKLTEPIFIVEGEKDANALADLGLAATTNAMGAGKWRPEYTEALRGAREVVIIPDADGPGRKHAARVAETLRSAVAVVKVLDLQELDKEGADVSDWLELGHGKDDLLELAAQTRAWTPPPWPEISVPVPKTSGPDFPTHRLPAPFSDFADAVATSIQVPRTTPALLDLGLVGAAGAGKVQVRMDASHMEPINNWSLSVLKTGERKSTTFSACFEPVYEWQAHQEERVRRDVAEYESQVRTYKKMLADAEREAAGTAWNSPEGDKARQIAQDLASLTARPVVMPKFKTTDATPEAVTQMLAEHGRILIASPEAVVIEQMSGRYSRDGKTPNLEIFLSGYTGDYYESDRVGRDRIVCKKPLISMALTTQPEVLAGLNKREGFKRGILARFWYGVPASMVGFRLGPKVPINDTARIQRNAAIMALLDMPMPDEPYTLEFDYKAQGIISDYGDYVEVRQRPGGDLHKIDEGWANRVRGGVVRLAGVLHMMKHAHGTPWNERISVETTENAIAITEEFLIPNARVAFGAMGVNPVTALAVEALEVIKRLGKEEVTRREVQGEIRGDADEKEKLDAALGLLEEWDVVRNDGTRKTGGSGRPAGPFYKVNPRVFAEGGDA